MSAIDLLLVLALLVTLPALVVAVGVLFQSERFRALLADRGQELAGLALAAWAACLGVAWWTDSDTWRLVASSLGIALATAIFLARARTAGT
jgi:hypothetical protein